MFHGNFCEKSHLAVTDFSCVCCVGFPVVSDFLLLASDQRSMSNPTLLNISIYDVQNDNIVF